MLKIKTGYGNWTDTQLEKVLLDFSFMIPF